MIKEKAFPDGFSKHLRSESMVYQCSKRDHWQTECRPTPQPRALGRRNEFELRNPQSFSWDGLCGEGDAFLVQISKNKEFTDLILERVVPSLRMSYDQFKEGTYYWRVCINAPEAERKWSEIIEFTLVDMSKRRPWQPGDPRIRFKGKDYEKKEPTPVQ